MIVLFGDILCPSVQMQIWIVIMDYYTYLKLIKFPFHFDTYYIQCALCTFGFPRYGCVLCDSLRTTMNEQLNWPTGSRIHKMLECNIFRMLFVANSILDTVDCEYTRELSECVLSIVLCWIVVHKHWMECVIHQQFTFTVE